MPVQELHLCHKHSLYEGLQRLSEATSQNLLCRFNLIYHPQALWCGSHPLNEHYGVEAITHIVWKPLLLAFPDLERRDLIFVGGSFEGRDYVATMGHYCGTFRQPWLGIPPTGHPISIRYGEIHQIEQGRIIQSNCLWDILDVMRQAGFWPLPPSLGSEGLWLGPLHNDGIVLEPTDAALSAANLAQTLAMHQALSAYDDSSHNLRQGLMKMPQKDYWHPKMMWYGPAGIGTTRGLQGFVDHHQLPFRRAFKRPVGTLEEVHAMRRAHGAGHYIRIGDGAYSVTGGWPSLHALHVGDGFLGQAPTGRLITMRVMDFYRHDEGLIRENWVPLDVIDFLYQIGVDVFARMNVFFNQPLSQ